MADRHSTSGSMPVDPSLERTFRGHKSYVTSVAFSPSLKQLASSAGDNCIMMWNFKPQLRAFRYIGHKDVVTDVEFSPGGDVLASASKDRTVRLWIPSAKGESTTLKGHTGAVRSVGFSNDSRNLITASDDKLVKIWQLPARTFQCSLVGHSNWVRSARFSSSSHLAASCSDDKTVKLWDVPTHQCLHSFYDHNDVVNTVRFHSDDTCVASGSADRTIKVWDVRSHQLIQHYLAHSDSVTSIDMHPSGHYLLSSSKDASLKIWDLREGRLLYTLHGHTGPSLTAKFSENGSFFASGGADQLVMVWKSNLLGCDNRFTVNSSNDWSDKLKNEDAIPKAPLPRWGNSGKGKPVMDRNTNRRSGDKSTATSGQIIDAATQAQSSTVILAGNQDNTPTVARGIAGQNLDVASAPRPSTAPSTGRVEGSHASSGSNSLVNREQLPPALAGTLDHIIGQLDVITRTMAILDNRLTLTEDRISSLLAHSRGLTVANPRNIHAADSRNITGDRSFEVEDVMGNSDSDEADTEDEEEQN